MPKAKDKTARTSRSSRTKSDSVSLRLSAYRGFESSGGETDRPTKPFSQSEWVFICVDQVVKTCRSIQMMLSTGGEDIVESGPAWDLLFGNPELPFSMFISRTAGYLSLYRECYWVFPEKDLIRPTKIMVYGPQQVKPEIRDGVLVGYSLTLEGRAPIPLYVDDVYPLLDFNPDSDLHGVGPATAGKLNISAAYQAAMLNESTLANGGRIGTVLVAPQGAKLDEEERRMLRSQFEHRHGGARNAGKTFLATGGLDVKQLAQSMVDLDMLQLRTFDSKAICAIFGVPPEIVGLATEAQYANGPAQQRFISSTIAPMLSFVADHITLGILRRFRFAKHASVKAVQARTWHAKAKALNLKESFRCAAVKAVQQGAALFAWFAVEEHPAIQEMIRERTGKVLDYTKFNLPLNAIITAYDLPFEPLPWGDMPLVTMGLVPIMDVVNGTASPTGEQLPEGQSPGDEPVPPKPEGKSISDIDEKDEQQRLRLWRKWVTSWASLEKEYQAAIRLYFLKQEKELIRRLRQVMGEKAVSDDIVARIVFDLAKENGKLRVINRVFFDKASRLGIAQGLSESGVAPADLPAKVKPLENARVLTARKVTSDFKLSKVSDVTADMVRRHLKSGIEQGSPIDELAKTITRDLSGNRARALSIARTQTAGAVNLGRMVGLKASGVEKKSWLTSRDDAVRDEHKAAEAKYSAGIPIDEPFVVGGDKLMCPGDPAGSAAMIINCRCLLLQRISGKSLPEIAFVSYEDTKSWK